MRKAPIISACPTLLFLIISIYSVSIFLASDAGAQNCFLEVCKSAPGAGEQGFLIDISDSGETNTFELFDGGDCITTHIILGNDVVITEQPTPGWTLDDVGCISSPAFVFEFVPGGVIVFCRSPRDHSTTCTFFNVPRTPENIPTLSEWAMIAAAAGLGLAGVFYAVRKWVKAV
jgi:hypothetical protein